jgi:hypothetical protein
VIVAFEVAKFAKVAFPVIIFALSALSDAKFVVPNVKEAAWRDVTLSEAIFAADKFA